MNAINLQIGNTSTEVPVFLEKQGQVRVYAEEGARLKAQYHGQDLSFKKIDRKDEGKLPQFRTEARDTINGKPRVIRLIVSQYVGSQGNSYFIQTITSKVYEQPKQEVKVKGKTQKNPIGSHENRYTLAEWMAWLTTSLDKMNGSA